MELSTKSLTLTFLSPPFMLRSRRKEVSAGGKCLSTLIARTSAAASLALTLVMLTHRFDKPRHSPDKPRHSSDKLRLAPDKLRHSSDKPRHSPDTVSIASKKPSMSRHRPASWELEHLFREGTHFSRNSGARGSDPGREKHGKSRPT